MDWFRKVSSRLREIASELDRAERPSLSGTRGELERVFLATRAVAKAAAVRRALLEQKVREEWTRTDLDYDPKEAIDEFEEAVEEAGAKVVDEGPDHLKMDVVRGREDELRDLSEEMVRGRHGPELEEFAKAYGA